MVLFNIDAEVMEEETFTWEHLKGMGEIVVKMMDDSPLPFYAETLEAMRKCMVVFKEKEPERLARQEEAAERKRKADEEAALARKKQKQKEDREARAKAIAEAEAMAARLKAEQEAEEDEEAGEA